MSVLVGNPQALRLSKLGTLFLKPAPCREAPANVLVSCSEAAKGTILLQSVYAHLSRVLSQGVILTCISLSVSRQPGSLPPSAWHCCSPARRSRRTTSRRAIQWSVRRIQSPPMHRCRGRPPRRARCNYSPISIFRTSIPSTSATRLPPTARAPGLR